MKQKAVYPRVTSDLFFVQLHWALGFLGVMFVIQLIKFFFAAKGNNEINDYFTSVAISSSIFMLVIGIMSVYSFLNYYVGNGVTRRDCFIGAAISAIGLSVAIPVIASIVSMIEYWIASLTGLFTIDANPFDDVVVESNVIGDVVQSVILSPFVDLESSWLLAILVLSLNIFISFIVGWFIGVIFYRWGIMLGLGSIFLSLAILYTTDSLLNIALELPVHGLLKTLPLSQPLSMVGVFILIGILLWVIRQTTKRVTVKM